MGYFGPIKTNPADGEATILNYGYTPSLAMGIVGIITFFIVMLGHLWWFIKKRGTRSLHGLMTVACVCEILGYGARISSHKWPYASMGFLASTYLIQVATILFTAAIYKAVTRIIKYAPDGRGRALTPMRPRSLLTLFIIFDVVMVIFQIASVYFGAAAESADHTEDDSMLGAGMAGMLFLAGTLVQTVTWLVFLGIFVCIARRTGRLMLALGANTTTVLPRLVPLTKIIYITWFLFFSRLIFRLAQAGQGQWEYAGTREWLFAVFEYLPMLFAIAIWAALPLSGFLFPDGIHPKARGEHHMNLGVNTTGSNDHTGVAPSTVASTHAGEKV